jgi:divalent metal cation (Fe/Co/Zn/Cd) transporter
MIKNEKKRVALLSVLAAIFLTGFKMIIGILTGSLGILSEALHSTLDLIAAVITFFRSVFLINRLIKNITTGMVRLRISQP